MTNKINSKIEKPWAVYYSSKPIGIGKVIDEYDNGFLNIIWAEFQCSTCDLSYISPKRVKRFRDLDKAIDSLKYLKGNWCSKESLIENVLYCFPSMARKELSQPKCTELPIKNNLETMGWFDHWFDL